MTITNPPYARCYPFGAPASGDDDQQAHSAEWRRLAGAWGDGIVNDRGVGPEGGVGEGFGIARSTSTRDVVINLRQYRLRGIHFDPTDDTLTLTPPAIVTSGKVRADRIITKLDPTTQRVTVEVKVGTEVTPPTLPTLPALTRVGGGVWEDSLWTLTGGNVAANALAVVDQRCWVAPSLFVRDVSDFVPLSGSIPHGTRLFEASTGHEHLVTYPAGIPTVLDLDALTMLPFPRSGSHLLDFSGVPLYGKRRGFGVLRGGFTHSGGALLAPANVERSLGTLPPGYRPPFLFVINPPTTFLDDASGGRLTIDTDGTVSVIFPYDTAWSRIDCVYPVAS